MARRRFDLTVSGDRGVTGRVMRKYAGTLSVHEDQSGRLLEVTVSPDGEYVVRVRQDTGGMLAVASGTLP